MTAADLRALINEELSNIAPETSPADVPDTDDFRSALDIDSIGFLDFIIALHARTGVEIPEIDYPKLITRAGLLAYLAAHGATHGG